MQQKRDALMRVERVKVGLDDGGELEKGQEEGVCVEEKQEGEWVGEGPRLRERWERLG